MKERAPSWLRMLGQIIGVGLVLFGIFIHSMGFDKPVFAFDSSPTPVDPMTVLWIVGIGVVISVVSTKTFVRIFNENTL